MSQKLMTDSHVHVDMAEQQNMSQNMSTSSYRDVYLPIAERIVGDMVLQGIPRKTPAKLLLVSLFVVIGFGGVGALRMAIVEPRDAGFYVLMGLLFAVMMSILWYIATRTKVKIPMMTKKGLIYVQEGDEDGETILRWREISDYDFIIFGSSSQMGRHLSLCAPNRLPPKSIKFAHCTDAFKKLFLLKPLGV